MSNESRDSRTLGAVYRALPNPHRPRLNSEMEAALEPLERRAALAYTDAELAAERLHAILHEVESDAIPVEDLWGDDSVVTHLQELRQRAEEED